MEKQTKKMIRNACLFILLIAVTYYFVFRNINMQDFRESMSNANLGYVLLAVLVTSGYITFEAFNLKRLLSLMGDKVTYLQALKYSCVNFFFSAITPAATGGQPFEIYYMHKDGASIPHASITVLVHSSMYLIVMILLGIVGYFVNFDLFQQMDYFLYFFIFGILANGTICTICLIAIFNRRLSSKLLNFGLKILKKFKVKNVDKYLESAERSLDECHQCAVFVIENKKNVLKCFCFILLQLVCHDLDSFFIIKALGVEKLNIIKTMFIQATLNLSVSILPLPGTVGVNESAFVLIYGNYIKESLIGSAMFLTRGVSFYFYVLLTGVIVLFIKLLKK